MKAFELFFFAGLASAPATGMQIMLLEGANQVFDGFMFEPVWATLKAGFAQFTRDDVNFTFGLAQANETLAQTAHLGKGDVFVWLGVHLARSVPWTRLHARGVRTVYYRTESHEGCAPPRWLLSESWEYSYANVRSCPAAAKQGPVVRYVPPGALPCARAGHPPGRPLFYFLGNTHLSLGLRGPQYKNRRRRCFATIHNKLPPDTLRAVTDMWSEATYARRMANMSVFLSIHKGCGLPGEALETFRVSKLLGYGGLVLSERSHAEDEASFAGLVAFCEVDAIADAYRKLAELPTAARAARGEAAAAAFAERFAPARLFEQAGVYAMLDDVRLQRPVSGPRVPPKLKANKSWTSAGAAWPAEPSARHKFANRSEVESPGH